ncbi:unnamed protein product [Amaranthus hypochondriacus]
MTAEISQNKKTRPVAEFHPCHWGDHFLHLSNPHHDEEVHLTKKEEANKLREEVKKELLETKGNPLKQLNFIDAIERLGVAYHFEHEIEDALHQIYDTFQNQLCANYDLHHVSTLFRILRQHGFHVSCDVFNKFKDEDGSFKEFITKDVEGLLSLYEASHVGTHNDKILDEALAFTTTHLNELVDNLTSPIHDKVVHALHQPLHKGLPRVESRHYIPIYQMDPTYNKTLLNFAILDFNLLQAIHQKELKDLKRWWKGLHLNVSFSRDRPTEAYFWILGHYFEPEFAFARKIYRKIFKATVLLDDTYDAYGTIDELELLTEMFQRPWDKSRADELPEHVKWTYYAMVEACEEAEEDLSKHGRSSFVNYSREQVKKICKAYLQEAKWCHQKYVPTYEEYMKNGIVTSPYQHGAVASFLGMGDIADKEVFEWACQEPMPKIIEASAVIHRLMNDMGSHEFEQKRNHVASAMQCLMEKHGMSKEEANKKLKMEIENAWKDINEAMLQPYVIPKPILTRILNLARCTDVIYKDQTDAYTHFNEAFKDKVASILSSHITM